MSVCGKVHGCNGVGMPAACCGATCTSVRECVASSKCVGERRLCKALAQARVFTCVSLDTPTRACPTPPCGLGGPRPGARHARSEHTYVCVRMPCDAQAYLLGLGGLQVSHLGLQFLQFLVEGPLGCLQLCLQLLHLFVLGLEGVLRLRKLAIYRSHLGLQPLLRLLGKRLFREAFPVRQLRRTNTFSPWGNRTSMVKA